MRIESNLNRLHARAVDKAILHKFADITRVLLSIGFFAPGLHKLMGRPFTTLPLDNPIGAFFNALYQTGFYYRFVGAIQVLAAVLVLFHRTSPLAALLFFSITLNVFIITVSIPFGTGTPIITGLMFLASLYLLCWNYDKLKQLMPFTAFTDTHDPSGARINLQYPNGMAGRIGYWIFAVAAVIVTCEMRGLLPRDLDVKWVALLVAFLGGTVMTYGFVIDIVKRPRTP